MLCKYSMLRFLDDGLISCPICAKRMKEEDVFAHLDVHNEPGDGRGIELKDTATRWEGLCFLLDFDLMTRA